MSCIQTLIICHSNNETTCNDKSRVHKEVPAGYVSSPKSVHSHALYTYSAVCRVKSTTGHTSNMLNIQTESSHKRQTHTSSGSNLWGRFVSKTEQCVQLKCCSIGFRVVTRGMYIPFSFKSHTQADGTHLSRHGANSDNKASETKLIL